MTSQDILSKYAGARVTRLIDREQEMTQIKEAIAAPAPHNHLFYIMWRKENESWGLITARCSIR